ncbi:MAG: hypothetical protein JO193_08820 [Candidatus Eremiobacteraeota bacterium]|nr:hypothetical protein [Candidatus Eremiobacteraeota bacterium]
MYMLDLRRPYVKRIDLASLMDRTALEFALGGLEIDPRLRQHATKLAKNAESANTIRNYKSNLVAFQRWAESYGLSPLPATGVVLALHIADADHLTINSHLVRLSAIAKVHDKLGLPCGRGDYVVKEMVRAYRRVHGSLTHSKRPIRPEQLRALVRLARRQPQVLRGLRDAALMLVQFGGALRSAELAFNVADLEFLQNGVRINLQRSKADPEGWGQHVIIDRGAHNNTCPVRALRKWLNYSGIVSGAVFPEIHRSGSLTHNALLPRAIYQIVRSYLKIVTDQFKDYGTHSMRSGWLTSGFEAGLSDVELLNQSRQKSPQTLLRYLRYADFTKRNLTALIGL